MQILQCFNRARRSRLLSLVDIFRLREFPCGSLRKPHGAEFEHVGRFAATGGRLSVMGMRAPRADDPRRVIHARRPKKAGKIPRHWIGTDVTGTEQEAGVPAPG